jgi:hypothetical protein
LEFTKTIQVTEGQMLDDMCYNAKITDILHL